VSSNQTASRLLPASDPVFLPTVESARLMARQGVAAACSLEFTIGDITTQKVDAIVNPVGPGLVDLAVRRAAGPALLDAFHVAVAELPHQKLRPGEAIVTPGFRLDARYVIHTAPPVYADDPIEARAQLAAGHREALTSIAFPAIATGVYRYPPAAAAEVAIGAVVTAVRDPDRGTRGRGLGVVRFVLSRPAMLDHYAGAAARR
jgi:O-acetyl-ADP-ribose deacetylase (regulator of RNase III)